MQVCTCRQNEVSQNIRSQIFTVSNLEPLKNLTFETFHPRGQIGRLSDAQALNLEGVYNQARQFSTTLNGWLLLQGGYGCGKTHLAAAIANFAVGMGVPTLFLTVPDLLDWMRFAYDSVETTFEERFEQIRTVKLLVLDDFGTQNATAWAQEKLFQIMNYRYINHLSLVITTNQELDEIEDRIRSRLQDPKLVTRAYIQAPDYRNPKEDAVHPELSSLHLHAQRTFDTFSNRQGEGLEPEELKSLDKAFTAARKFAEKPNGWLVFSGTYGSGKTHLAAAIGNYRAALGDPPMLVVVPDLLDHLRATFSPNSNTSYDHRFEEVRTTPLLILDDLGTQSATAWAREKLYQLFNSRYNAELPTIITTSNTMDELDPRIRSRMMDARLCTVHAITAPSYRGGARPASRSTRTRAPKKLGS